jgi:glycosyltransferase involved in cell wall biosynthesis
MDTQFKVSVRLMTYNQEKYIAQAISSVLVQKTNFPVELIIGDDLSTDATLSIANSFKSTDNVKIIILDRHNDPEYKENRKKLGRNYNNTDILKNCNGKYIAMLEGDDYWTDSLKLQKQVDFLENNNEYALCYHHVEVLQEEGFNNRRLVMKKEQPQVSSIKEILEKSIWAHTNSVLFRNSDTLQGFPNWFYKCVSADWALLSIITGHLGKIYYMDETMSVYRQHNNGLWSKATQLQKDKNTIKTAFLIRNNFATGLEKHYIDKPIRGAYSGLIDEYRTSNTFSYIYYKIRFFIFSFFNKPASI